MINLEQFEQYGLGRLSEVEQRQFEQALSQQSELQAGIKDWQSFLEALDRLGLEDIRHKLNKIQISLESEDYFLTEEDLDTLVVGTGPEKDRVATKIGDNPHYQSMAREHQDMTAIVDTAGIAYLQSQLDQAAGQLEQGGFFNTESSAGRSGRIIRFTGFRKWALPVAATLALLLGLIYFLSLDQQTAAPTYSWNQPHLTEVLEESSVSGLASPDQLMLRSREEGLQLILRQDYSQAVSYWQGHLESWPQDYLGRFYYAQSLRENSQWSAAISQWKMLVEITDFPYREDALFHLALCELQIEDGCTAAIQHLDQLLQAYPTSMYRQEALTYKNRYEPCP